MKRPYNTTSLNPETTFEKHVFHRDQFAHYLRWTHILKEAKIGEHIVDFGCGEGNLLEVLYRNRFKCASYTGFDIRPKTIEQAKEKFKKIPWASFHCLDLIKDHFPFYTLKADKVVSFEVIEHIGKQNIDTFLARFKMCGHDSARFYLSTPNYDEKVGAAKNHIYDSGDGRGEAVQEFTHEELDIILCKEFCIIRKFGTFASQRDYFPLLSPCQLEVFQELQDYYDTNLLANIMAPFFPEVARNCMWVLAKE